MGIMKRDDIIYVLIALIVVYGCYYIYRVQEALSDYWDAEENLIASLKEMAEYCSKNECPQTGCGYRYRTSWDNPAILAVPFFSVG